MKIVAIGGASSSKSFRRLIGHALSLTGKKKPNVLMIPTAISDEKDYVDNFNRNYGKALNCSTDTLLIAKERMSGKEMQRKVEWADAIHVCGGNTLKMMRRWRYIGLDSILVSAAGTGKVMYGESAGAICWFCYGHSDSMSYYEKKDWKYIRVKCLGLIRGVACPHYRKEKRVKDFDSMVRKGNIKGIAIDNDCAVCIVDGKIYSYGTRKDAHAFVIGNNKRKLIRTKILRKKARITDVL